MLCMLQNLYQLHGVDVNYSKLKLQIKKIYWEINRTWAVFNHSYFSHTPHLLHPLFRTLHPLQ